MFSFPHSTLIYSLLACILRATAGAEETSQWQFLALADFHGAETFATKPDFESNSWKKWLGTLKYIHDKYGGDLVLLPGDTQNGKWTEDNFIEKINSELSPQEAVLLAGRNCYGTMKKLFAQAGYEKILVAVGDHELGGNSWKKNSQKVLSLPSYRQSFTKSLNRDSNGNFLYEEPIGSAPSRPLGTAFDNTSYAHRHKNALFITLDVFETFRGDKSYFDRENGTGGEGVLSCTVGGEHLVWFENVLQQARADLTISHIFVQGHVPIAHPVRQINCSGQFLDNGEDSELWRLMNLYEVDIYFAGEVHANTVIKSQSSNLIQISSRGNVFNNFLQILVEEEKIHIVAFNEIGSKPRWNDEHDIHGNLIIDKSLGIVTMDSDGALEILDRNSPLIHISFEGAVPLETRQIIGMTHDDIGEKLIGSRISMRDGIVSSQAMANQGEFGQQYDGQIVNIPLESGIIGYAGLFSDESRFAFYSTGPFSGGDVASVSLWINTVHAQKQMILVHYGAIFGSSIDKTTKDFFTLVLDNGVPTVYLGKKKILKSTGHNLLADGQWHHIAVSMPTKSCLLSQVNIYVDGIKTITWLLDSDDYIFTTTSGRLSLGGYGYSAKYFDDIFPEMETYSGYMDDFKFHSRPLTSNDFVNIIPLVSSPAPAPTEIGDNLCQDYKKKFRFNGTKRTCKWVQNNWKTRCVRDEARENCPVTCREACQCFDTPGMFWFKGLKTDCKLTQESQASRCQSNRVRSHCPVTCGICQ